MFKLEGQLIARHPEYHMEGRRLLDKIDREKGTVTIDGKAYPLEDTNFPTIDPADPYRLSAGETLVMEKLRYAFVNSEKLRRHVAYLFTRGSMYRVCNGNLLYHGCVPLEEDGSFKKVQVGDNAMRARSSSTSSRAGRERGINLPDGEEKRFGQDLMWFMWANENSPLYGKERMTTFERYFVKDQSCYFEAKKFLLQLSQRRCRHFAHHGGIRPRSRTRPPRTSSTAYARSPQKRRNAH